MNFGISFGMASFAVLTAGSQAVCTSHFGAKPDDPCHPDFMNVLRSMSKSEGIDFWVPMYYF